MGTAVISPPAKLMRPEAGLSWPLSCAISVVLPPSLGPITACNSPSGMPKVRSSVAVMPPKRFARFSTPSKSVMVNLLAHLAEKAINAAAREQHHEQQGGSEDSLPIFGDTGKPLLQHQQRHRAEQRAECRAHAAEHDHDDEIAGPRPIHHPGADEIGVSGEQGAGEAAERARNEKAGELVTIGWEADGAHACIVRPGALNRQSKAGIHDAP